MSKDSGPEPVAPNRRSFLRWVALTPPAAVVALGAGTPGCSNETEEAELAESANEPVSQPGGESAVPATPSSEGASSGTNEPSGEPVGQPAVAPNAEPSAAPSAEPDPAPGVDPEEPTPPEGCSPTGSDVEGPFFELGAPQRTVLAPVDEPGERLLISGVVWGPDCKAPLVGALLDVWQADVEGNYHGGAEDAYRLRAQLLTDATGKFSFESIRPGNYAMSGSFRPAHIHFTVSAPGFGPLTTQLYFDDDPYLAPNDPCGGCNSGDPTQIIHLESETDQEGVTSWSGVFDVVLKATG